MSPRGKSILIAVLLLVVLLATAGVLTWAIGSQIQNSSPSLAPTQTSSATPAPSATKRSSPVVFRPRFRARELQILESPYFTIGYDNQRKNPAWVVYRIDGPIVNTSRSPDRPRFQTDFRTSAHVADSDYINSGFDRGHMVPAYAMWSRYGVEAFTSTFTLSNVVPQKHGMNAGIWEDLEDNIAGQVRSGAVADQGYAGRLRNITVINGPIYEGTVAKLRNGTWIPSACFSIVLDHVQETGGWRVMAFEIPNTDDVKGPLGRWFTTAKKIEEKTGIDFFDGNEEMRRQVEEIRAEKVW
jgi:endonuclease G